MFSSWPRRLRESASRQRARVRAASPERPLRNVSHTVRGSWTTLRRWLWVWIARRHLDKADALREQGQFDGALGRYGLALRHNPELIKAYRGRAVVHESLDDPEGAIDNYGQVIRLNPQLGDAYQHRADARRQLGRFEQAIGDYGEAIRLNPQLQPAYFNRGVCYDNIGRP